MIGRKGHHGIGSHEEMFWRLDLVDPEIERFFRFRSQQTVTSKVPDKGFRSPQCSLTRGVKLQQRSANYAEARAAREEMRQVEMVCVRMRLQAVPHVIQRTGVHLRRRHDVGPEVNQQIVVDQHGRPFRRLRPPSMRAWAQFRHLQKASGKAFAAAVPRKVILIAAPRFRVTMTDHVILRTRLRGAAEAIEA